MLPLAKVEGRDYAAAMHYGQVLGKKIVAGWQVDKPLPVTGELSVAAVDFSHRISNVSILAAIYVGLLDVDLHGFNQVQTQLYRFRFGDQFSLLTFPGEPLSRLLLSLLDSSHPVMVASLTGASYGYFIPSDEYGLIEDRSTEENACIHPNAGDNIRAALSLLLRADKS